jgi:WD40 repeat protein
MKYGCCLIPLMLVLTLGLNAQTPIFRTPVLAFNQVVIGNSRVTLSHDQLTMYWVYLGAMSMGDLSATSRSNLLASWGNSVPVMSLNTNWEENAVAPRQDHLEIIVASERPGGTSNLMDLWSFTRSTQKASWGNPQPLTSLNGNGWDGYPSLTGDGLEIFYARMVNFTKERIFRATRKDLNSTWSAPSEVKELAPGYCSTVPSITSDGLSLFFSSDRPGGLGDRDYWMATRNDRNSPFASEVPVTELNTQKIDAHGCITADGFSFYFCRKCLVYHADRILPICIPTGQPTRGQVFEVACRRDPGDVGVIVGSIMKMSPTIIPGAQGALSVHPSFIVWQVTGLVGNMGRFTTRIPIPGVAVLKGLDIHWQAGAQDPAKKVFISPLVTTTIQ